MKGSQTGSAAFREPPSGGPPESSARGVPKIEEPGTIGLLATKKLDLSPKGNAC